MKIEKRQLKNIRFGIVIFSILLMICSALISYSLVKRNDDKIANLQSEITKKQEAIDNIWQSSLNQETRIDNAILISLLSKNHKKDYSKIIKHYTESEDDSIDGLIRSLDQVRENKENIIKIINNLYDEKIIAENEITKKSQENKFYTAIAIFLQLLSVVLITITPRDLKVG